MTENFCPRSGVPAAVFWGNMSSQLRGSKKEIFICFCSSCSLGRNIARSETREPAERRDFCGAMIDDYIFEARFHRSLDDANQTLEARRYILQLGPHFAGGSECGVHCLIEPSTFQLNLTVCWMGIRQWMNLVLQGLEAYETANK